MRKSSLLVLVLGLAGCRDTSSGDDTPQPDAPNTSDVTIQEIQNDSMAPGTPVTVKGVVVTAIDNFGMRTGDFWVQEPGGGEFSGVVVAGAPLDQVAALAVGDVVDISGAVKDEFALSSDTSGNTVTELSAPQGGSMTVAKVSSGTAPAPAVVDALAIGQLTNYMDRHAAWEKWEGVPVTLANVRAFSGPECILSQGNCNDPTYERFDITGDIQVQSSLAAMPSPDVDTGDCFTGITGVVNYFFDYQILPRTTAEIATGGTACAVENMTALCGDGMDNDGNGFKDCADNACVVGSSTCRMNEDADIADIQAGTEAVGNNVLIQDAIVMAVSVSKNDVWISTSSTAATNNGIQIHFNDDVPDTVTVGKTIDVIGKIIEFNDAMNMGTGTLTQLAGYSITVKAAAAVTPTALAGNASTLSNDGTGEPYESVLVTLSNVEITTAAESMYHVGTMTANGTAFKFDDTVHRLTQEATLDTCFTSIKGIWSYNVYDNHWVFFPVGPTTSSACP